MSIDTKPLTRDHAMMRPPELQALELRTIDDLRGIRQQIGDLLNGPVAALEDISKATRDGGLITNRTILAHPLFAADVVIQTERVADAAQKPGVVRNVKIGQFDKNRARHIYYALTQLDSQDGRIADIYAQNTVNPKFGVPEIDSIIFNSDPTMAKFIVRYLIGFGGMPVFATTINEGYLAPHCQHAVRPIDRIELGMMNPRLTRNERNGVHFYNPQAQIFLANGNGPVTIERIEEDNLYERYTAQASHEGNSLVLSVAAQADTPFMRTLDPRFQMQQIGFREGFNNTDLPAVAAQSALNLLALAIA